MKTKSLIIIPLLIIFISCNSQHNESVNNNTSIVNEEEIIITEHHIAKYPDIKSIPAPKAFKRVEVKDNSYGQYLRSLELKTENNIVYLYNGKEKWNQSAQFAILKIDVGTRDLQQCADAVMRLRAEHLYTQKKYNEIHFNFLSDGKARYYTSYAKGDYSQKKFRKYMDYIFSYANTSSLKNELKKVDVPNDMQIGDVFIQKGSPYGHAVTVMDLAENEHGEKIFLLSQSYMPAQEIHILINPNDKSISPWYKVKESGNLKTPEWTFTFNDLMRF